LMGARVRARRVWGKGHWLGASTELMVSLFNPFMPEPVLQIHLFSLALTRVYSYAIIAWTRASDRGRIGVGLFYAFKMPKRIGDDVGNFKYVFTPNKFKFFWGGVKMTPRIHFIHFIMQEYDSKCLIMNICILLL
jgi:hypothetical protein